MNFGGFDHADVRVKSIRAVETFYDTLMPALGLPRKRRAFVDKQGEWHSISPDQTTNAIEYYEPEGIAHPAHFVGFIEDPQMQPSQTRIAFRLPPDADWRAFLDLLSTIGARNLEVSADLQQYPALFFEDPAGTRLELCWRSAPPASS
jgi:catechol 2,3-dioxygenase-like lactoylglutathione lyase family enzyme